MQFQHAERNPNHPNHATFPVAEISNATHSETHGITTSAKKFQVKENVLTKLEGDNNIAEFTECRTIDKCLGGLPFDVCFKSFESSRGLSFTAGLLSLL